MEKIAYEPHPVTPERKAELRNQGFKIIDVRFKPAGEQGVDDGLAGTGGIKRSKGLNVEQIQAELRVRGIEFSADAKKPELAKLLDEAE